MSGYGGYDPSSGSGGYSNPYSSGGSSSGSGSTGSGSSAGYAGSYITLTSKMDSLRLAHGVLASLAWVIFLPAGAIQVRLVPSRYAVWIHAGFQVFGYILFLVAVALGIKLVYEIRSVSHGYADLFNNYHPIIGLTLFAFLTFQPILGYIHHVFYKKTHGRTLISYIHIWLGRVLITLGIINGGLGLLISEKYQANVTTGEIVYGVFAGVIWIVYVSAAVYGELQRRNPPEKRATLDGSPASSLTDGTETRRESEKPLDEERARYA